MDFKQIEAFVNVVNYKGFSKAADATFLTQPTISAHIGNLENELGTILLNRLGREVTMTKEGEIFFPYALSLLQTRMEATSCVKTKDSLLTGILDIQTSTIPGHYFLPKVMAGFREAYSGVCFHVEQSDSKKVMSNIINGQGEIGFTGYQSNNHLIYEHIFTDEMMLLTSTKGSMGLLKGNYITYEEFENEPFIIREEDSGSKIDLIDAKINGLEIVKESNIVARMNSLEGIKQAVAAGLGISVVSGYAAKKLEKEGDVRAFYIRDLIKKRNFYMVYQKDGQLSPIAQRFRDYVMTERSVFFHG